MKKYRFLLLPFTASAIIGLTMIFIALPKIRSFILVKKDLKEKQEKLADLTEKASLLKGLNDYQLKEQVEILEKVLPSKKKIAEILTILAFLASETNTNLVDFSIVPGELMFEGFEEIVFQAGFKGSIKEVKMLLGKINQALPVMRVVSFAIEEDVAGLEIESYVSALPEFLGKIDDPLPEISLEEENVYQQIAGFETIPEELLQPVPLGKEDLFADF